MQFSTNPTTSVFLLTLLICQHGIGYGIKGRSRSTTPRSITEESSADQRDEAESALMEIADQNSGKRPVDILDAGLQVAEEVASLAPSPVGPLLSFGMTLFGMSDGGKEDPYKKIEKIVKSMEKASEERDSQTQSLIVEKSEELKGVVIEESKRVEGVVIEQSSRVIEEVNKGLQKNDKASRGRDALTQFLILEQSKRLEGVIISESIRVIKNLTDTFDSHVFMRDMRRQLEDFEAKYAVNIACLLNSHCKGPAKEFVLDRMMDPVSDFRSDLRSFISNYIEPQHRNLQNKYNERFFFDFLFHDVTEKARDNKDCSTQSIHTEILKSFMYISKTLTDAYTLIATAHAVRYREYLATNAEPDKIATVVDQSVKISDEYLARMKTLTMRTKNTLKEAPGEFRKCDPTKFVEGETFDHLDFFGIVSQVRCENLTAVMQVLLEKLVKVIELRRPLWEFSEAIEKFRPDGCPRTMLPLEAFFAFCDPDVLNGTTTLVKRKDRNGDNFYISRKEGEIEYSLHPLPEDTILKCFLQLRIGFSILPKVAKPGNVITGIRWRISHNIIYIDIEEGKFIDGTRVDENTVEWSVTDEFREVVVPFNNIIKGILLEDVRLKPGVYLTGVQMILVNGKLTLSLIGAATNPQGTQLSNNTDFVQPEEKDYSEFVLNHRGDPKTNLKHSENVVMRNQGQYYVNFQETNSEKADDRKTIPYFDIQEVYTDPPAPIGGLGIYHKAVPGYGGFLGLKILSPDYGHMLNNKIYYKYSRTFKIKPNSATSKKI